MAFTFGSGTSHLPYFVFKILFKNKKYKIIINFN